VSEFTFVAAENKRLDVAEARQASFMTAEAELSAHEAQLSDIIRTRFLDTSRAEHPATNQVRKPLTTTTIVVPEGLDGLPRSARPLRAPAGGLAR
jgi:hypothetical protein